MNTHTHIYAGTPTHPQTLPPGTVTQQRPVSCLGPRMCVASNLKTSIGIVNSTMNYIYKTRNSYSN